MKRNIWMLLLGSILITLTACGNDDTTDSDAPAEEELHELIVDFDVPETADVDETIELKATVTYGDEDVTDAEVVFEYWEQGNEEDSTNVDAVNNEDGTYTAEIDFDHDGAFEMYAHTDAKELHTMPKKAVAVGDAEIDENAEEHEHHHAEGFDMHFTEPENVQADEDTDLVTRLEMDDAPFEKADVRYEIWSDNSEKHEWVDAEESDDGEYTAAHAFAEAGTYHIQIHVEDDDGLHEHEEHDIEVE